MTRNYELLARASIKAFNVYLISPGTNKRVDRYLLKRGIQFYLKTFEKGTTSIKPSGTVSLLSKESSGIHPGFYGYMRNKT